MSYEASEQKHNLFFLLARSITWAHNSVNYAKKRIDMLINSEIPFRVRYVIICAMIRFLRNKKNLRNVVGGMALLIIPSFLFFGISFTTGDSVQVAGYIGFL